VKGGAQVFDRTIEPTTSDLIGSMTSGEPWASPHRQPSHAPGALPRWCRECLAIAQEAQNDQAERLAERFAVAPGPLSRAIVLSQMVREAEERAAVKYAADLQGARRDVWGHTIVTASDGHSAYACNDQDCTRHPASLYGR
jgi:hypothetical protein